MKNEVNRMVELLGANIRHNSFGVGKVIELTDTYLKIEFSIGIKQFQFPEAFEKFLQCEDERMQEKILEMLVAKKEQEAELKRQKQEEKAAPYSAIRHFSKNVWKGLEYKRWSCIGIYIICMACRENNKTGCDCNKCIKCRNIYRFAQERALFINVTSKYSH